MKMKLSALAIVLVLSALVASPAYALFTNGGFEDGTFNGWTLRYGNVVSNTALPVWGSTPYGTITPVVMEATSPNQPGQTLDVNPYQGDHMARINDIFGNYHATGLSQSDTIAAADLTETIYIAWGAMLVDPRHPVIDQPFFQIQVLKNGTLMDTFSANATNAATSGSGWVTAGADQYGSTLWYKSGQYSYNLSSFAIGDTITVDMFVADCGQSAHGAFAFLDGLGTTPVISTPEPATMLLFGMGLLGAGIMRRKYSK